MIKTCTLKNLPLMAGFLLLIAVASCSKDKTSNTTNGDKTVVNATPQQVGMYAQNESVAKFLVVAISKIGTSTANDYGLQFDTGSGGLVIDATDIIPSSMINTSSGFVFTGDSTVVNGITITNQTQVIEYGDDDASLSKVYGNLAYAPVTIGDQPGDKVVIARLAFFLYYKAIDSKGNKYPKHEFDIFGVAPAYDIVFSNGTIVQSPLSYYEPGTGLTKGYKLAPVPASSYDTTGKYVPGALTLGLTASDLSSTSGYTMHTLNSLGKYGYDEVVPGFFNYNGGNNISTDIVYDTGTTPYSFLEDNSIKDTDDLLPANVPVTTGTNAGFTFNYTTTKDEDLTFIESPSLSGATVSIVSIEFTLTNSLLMDYADHKMGLKAE